MISEAEALNAAREIAVTSGWTWLEPVTVTLKKKSSPDPAWIVHSNANAKGCNVHVELEASSGRIIAASLWPRQRRAHSRRTDSRVELAVIRDIKSESETSAVAR